MKPLEYPRVSLIWGGVGVLLFLALGIMDVASGAPAFRVAAYFLLVIGAIYIFVRALMTILGKTRQQAGRHNPQSGSNPENRSI
ncbi:hypothetical protein NIBR502772_10435 [Pseudarthrobacter sp. NIBRBAC000502772]|uniref:hypothetical protein n=1 Tax=Pseudarthrobacter sp. NIBRBAC000502772 TaxID=2590775 RepID=UPI001131717E|nr:hypothetical protein [Pseudarthrobacter sp. NIBRBAC000502772]QDG66573.1 hypothetical protein NIBR502772_10435 [Pseudarthrobacter sp. NIBRBAC000502772]